MERKALANLQVIAVVGSDGQKCDLIFLEDGQRLNSFTYVESFEKKSLPVGKSNIWRIMVAQHDGASCHTSKFTQQFLRTEALIFP
ncbi:Uncharacterized protein FKW44_012965 [Caligus rogercresseyi]|uniref:Uncharacterized protein n=1 Tax=Caligus rogercresseyi TaxID=217165 RepID=A0A7T8HK75_CALRO|nr:Uncharacterized protein FKW44_012965 [Caligus rogercresseyi]